MGDAAVGVAGSGALYLQHPDPQRLWSGAIAPHPRKLWPDYRLWPFRVVTPVLANFGPQCNGRSDYDGALAGVSLSTGLFYCRTPGPPALDFADIGGDSLLDKFGHSYLCLDADFWPRCLASSVGGSLGSEPRPNGTLSQCFCCVCGHGVYVFALFGVATLHSRRAY